MIKQFSKALNSVKIVVGVVALGCLGIYLNYIMSVSAITSAYEFAFLLLVNVLIYVFFQYVVAPYLFRRFAYRVLLHLLGSFAVLLLFVVLLVLLSFFSGALTWPGFNDFYIENFWPVVLPFVVPAFIGMLFYYIEWFLLFKIEVLHYQEQYNTVKKEVVLLDYKVSQQGICPHFLFNTLNTLNYMLVHSLPNTGIAMDLMIRIVDFYLKRGSVHFNKLKDEMQQVSNLLKIYRIRKGKKIQLIIGWDRKLLAGRKIPGMLLINLIENSCQYGLTTVAKKPAVLLIELLENNGIRIYVKNYMAQAPLEEVVSGGGRLAHMQRHILSMHADNRFEILKGLDTFEVDIHYYEPKENFGNLL